jgi:hypothetical protein
VRRAQVRLGDLADRERLAAVRAAALGSALSFCERSANSSAPKVALREMSSLTACRATRCTEHLLLRHEAAARPAGHQGAAVEAVVGP